MFRPFSCRVFCRGAGSFCGIYFFDVLMQTCTVSLVHCTFTRLSCCSRYTEEASAVWCGPLLVVSIGEIGANRSAMISYADFHRATLHASAVHVIRTCVGFCDGFSQDGVPRIFNQGEGGGRLLYVVICNLCVTVFR